MLLVSHLLKQQLSLVLQQDYIECECYRLGEFAVTNDLERGYGWTIPAGAVAALNIVSNIIIVTGVLYNLAQTKEKIMVLQHLIVLILIYFIF